MGSFRAQVALIAAVIPFVFGSGCDDSGQRNDAANDLLQAFQTGCSINGGYLQLALTQTQNVSNTLNDLKQKNSCAGVDGALNAIQNLQSQVNAISQNQNASQVSASIQNQQMLMLEINAATDPAVRAQLISEYSYNMLSIGEAEAEMAMATGGLGQTPFQAGSSQVEKYLSQIFSSQTGLMACSQDNPVMAAQLGAGMLAVAGSFTAPVTGLALSLAGNALNDVFQFINNSSYTDEINSLNQVMMTTALPCGLEQMTDIYCQAQDVLEITHLEECSYNPNAPGCPAIKSAKPGAKSTGVTTTAFWKGIDLLTRDLPPLQAWIETVVTGNTPSDHYSAQQMNSPADGVSTMEDVKRLAQGVMKEEEQNIAGLSGFTDRDKELRNGLALLLVVLDYDTTALGCLSEFSSSSACNNPTPIFHSGGSTTKTLYDLVGRDPSVDHCIPGSLQSGCQDPYGIPLNYAPAQDPSAVLAFWKVIEANAGGLPTAIPNGLDLIDTTEKRELELEHQKLDTDPSGVLNAVNDSNEGAPSPIKALQDVDAFLKQSYAFFSDPTQVPDTVLDGGAAMRPGILGEVTDTQTIVEKVMAELPKTTGSSQTQNDAAILSDVFQTLNLGKDRNYLYNRIKALVHRDVHTRIAVGQLSSDIYEILSQAGEDPSLGLSQIAPEQMETTIGSLGQAQMTAQLNAQEFAKDFGKAFNGVLQLLKSQADANGEQPGASARIAPSRAAQARVCLLLVTSQNEWPSDVDVGLCRGQSYVSELTGQKLSFDDYYAQMQNGTSKVPERICSFYRFYRTSENYAHEKQGH